MNTVITLLAAAVAYGTPLLFAAIGETIAERAGVINLGLEGIMLIGAVTGFLVMNGTGTPLVGILVAVAAGAAAASVHAYLTVTLNANQIVSGLGLAIAGTGLSAILGHSVEGQPPRAQFHDWSIPLLHRIPGVGRILFEQDPLVYLGLLCVPVVWWLLHRTRVGLHLRSVGENPAAADAVGIPIRTYRFVAVLVGGAFAGLAGAALSLAESPGWTQNMTAGRGFIALALVIFGTWNPVRVMLGAYFFGALDVLGFRAQTIGVTIEPTLLAMVPYVATILVLIAITLAGARRRLGAPAALGEGYVREA
jgi:simple sugar transport system permease protein